jgi:hypothetical protein
LLELLLLVAAAVELLSRLAIAHDHVRLLYPLELLVGVVLIVTSSATSL